MAVIVTNANWLQVDGARLQKGKWDLSLTKTGVRLSDAGQSVNIPYMDTTIDGAPVESAADLFAFFESQGFKQGGTGPGTGVQSVTGDGVGGTATNVVISYPSPEDIGAATADQGALADTAVQPGDLPATPTWTTISGKPAFVAEGDNAAAARTALGLGTAATTASTAYATSAQGALADTAVQPAALSSGLAGKLDIGTGTQSGTTYRRGDGTWATPPNTTYSAISQANIEAPASTTTGLITGQRLAQGVVASSRSIVAVSGSKTLALTDEYTFQNVTAASTITVPANATVALPVGSQIDFFQAGAGVITFAAAGGVTIISKGSTLATSEAGDAATLKKTATNTWALIIGG